MITMDRPLLSTWNQIAPRVYMRQCYCFPYRDNGGLEPLKAHLTLALNQLAKHIPVLAGRLFLLSNRTGHLCIGLDSRGEIPLKVLDQRDSFGWTYAQLKAQGFPAEAFVSKSFDLPHQLLEDQKGIPVLEVHARVIEGGLLLCLYNHHSISDGTGMNNHISSFADLTRDLNRKIDVQYSVNFHADLPERNDNSPSPRGVPNTFFELLELCPEYSLLSSPTGPTQFRVLPTGTSVEGIKKTGRTFVIGTQQINNLKEKLVRVPGANPHGRLPSTFTCLAAITWAHVTKARLSSSKNYLLNSSPEKTAFPKNVRLMISIDWRRRAFASIMSSSAGNTVALPITNIDTATLLAACSSEQHVACTALGAVVLAIDAAVRGVDDDFVARRTALIRAASDPRLIGLSADASDPHDFYFNTWRHFGTQTRWRMPGLEGGNGEDEDDDGIAPDAIRRIQADWNMGAGLILPERKDSAKFEVLVTLDVDGMAALCAEPSWKNWVDDVVE